MEGIWYVVGFAVAGVSFVFLTIGVSWLISHRTRGSELKGLPYESGIPTYGDTHGRFGVSYYIYALLFVAFDILRPARRRDTRLQVRQHGARQHQDRHHRHAPGPAARSTPRGTSPSSNTASTAATISPP